MEEGRQGGGGGGGGEEREVGEMKAAVVNDMLVVTILRKRGLFYQILLEMATIPINSISDL